MSNKKPIVAKFGGSSMADANAIRQVVEIINLDPERRFIVVSAPGKNNRYPEKITDQLLAGNWEAVRKRFLEEGRILNWKGAQAGLNKAFEDFSFHFNNPDYRASRGEWLAARMLSDLIGAKFIDAAQLIRINPDGTVNEISYDLIASALGSYEGKVVIPGFYGLDLEGNLKTFPRGGSDISGAVIARGVNAEIYENWTDVDGVMTHDPKFHREARSLERIMIDHMIEMARNGARVLHPDCLTPIMNSGIPLLVKNTFNISHAGTLVITDQEVQS
jgi:aspartate kinase